VYKPNFCSECGERVLRARWHLWTNRRFCDDCARRLRKSQMLNPLIAGTALLTIGLIAGRSARPKPPPLIIQRGQFAASIPTGSNVSPVDSGSSKPAGSQPGAFGPDGSPTERPTDPNEPVSICGARTKKGAPCSRRVRGIGRCWQHKGMPAMLPPEKLLVKE
jgi:hypothetical protein